MGELDEVTQINQRLEQQMNEDAKKVQLAEMKPKFEEYPQLEAKLEQLRKEYTEATAGLAKVQDERDNFEDRCIEMDKKGKGLVSKEVLKEAKQRHSDQMKEVRATQSQLEHEREEATE